MQKQSLTGAQGAQLLVAFVVLFSLIMGVIAFIKAADDRAEEKRVAEAPSRVIEERAVSWRTSRSYRRSGYNVQYSYSVGGKHTNARQKDSRGINRANPFEYATTPRIPRTPTLGRARTPAAPLSLWISGQNDCHQSTTTYITRLSVHHLAILPHRRTRAGT